MGFKQNQTYRALSMYERLSKGQILTKKQEEENFDVGEKTIQRDIDNIRLYLETEKINEYLVYDREQKGYRLETNGNAFLSSEEILAVLKIIIESRAFPKSDMQQLVDKIALLAQPEHQEYIKKLLLNETYHYIDLHHKQSLFDDLWKLSKAVYTKRLVQLRYKKETEQEPVERIVKPVGLIFSEYYFYLTAYQTNKELDYPTIYRVDRIINCEVLNEHFKIPYSDRFQEGEFRKRVQFMYAGELMRVKFRYTGHSPKTVLDRLPTAKILTKDENGIIYEAEVFGEGIKMWLLSQGENVEVLEPASFRDEMRKTISQIADLYKS